MKITDNHKQDENSYEQKIYHKVEDQKTSSWRQSKPATNLFSSPALLAKDKNNEDKTAQPVQQGRDDFWTPALNTKQKYTDTLKSVNNSNEGQTVLQQFNNQIQPTSTMPVETHKYNESTQILKSLLGLSINQAQAMTDSPVISKVCIYSSVVYILCPEIFVNTIPSLFILFIVTAATTTATNKLACRGSKDTKFTKSCTSYSTISSSLISS